jgi:probable blue pigment (indigoidine) exporter
LFSWATLNEKLSKLSIVAAIAGFEGVGLLVLGPTARLDSVGIFAALSGAAS